MDCLTTDDGLALQLHHWPAMAGTKAIGRVLIVHGLGEHAGRYAHVAAALNGAGWHADSFDLRGHGGSAGPRGGLARPDALCADLAAIIDHLRRPGEPLVLLGHSMGGVIAARFVAEALSETPAAWLRPVDGLVLSSPALDPGMNAFQRTQLAVAEKLAPDFAVGNGLKPEWVSRDPAVVQAYVKDPLVHDRITPRLVRFILDAGVTVRALAGRWRVPTLLMWAGADRCVAPAGSAEMAERAPPAVLQARAFPGLAHEIFNEPERDEVLAQLVAWLQGLRPAG